MSKNDKFIYRPPAKEEVEELPEIRGWKLAHVDEPYSDPNGKFYDTEGKRITVKRKPKDGHYWLECEDDVFHEHKSGSPIILNSDWVLGLRGKEKK